MNEPLKKTYKSKPKIKREMTYDEMDAMCERFAQSEYQCGDWWPTMEEVQKILEPKIKANLEFIIWITETADEPVTEEQKEVRRYLLRLINQSVRLKEE